MTRLIDRGYWQRCSWHSYVLSNPSSDPCYPLVILIPFRTSNAMEDDVETWKVKIGT